MDTNPKGASWNNNIIFYVDTVAFIRRGFIDHIIMNIIPSIDIRIKKLMGLQNIMKISPFIFGNLILLKIG